jgi:DNA repair protein RadC
MTDVIADLPVDERPRERMFRHGPETLSDAELIAVLLGSGVPGKNAIQLARTLLADGMTALSRRETSGFLAEHGVGPAKASRIVAAIELARRLASGEPETLQEFDVRVFGPKLVATNARHTQERLGAAFLNSRHAILSQREIYIGTIDSAFVGTRDIVRLALAENACAVVVYHNHPSGNPQPSDEDILFTQKLRQALRLVDLQLIDHIITGAQKFYSLAEKGYL